jgi:hypothetical protein
MLDFVNFIQDKKMEFEPVPVADTWRAMEELGRAQILLHIIPNTSHHS